MNSLVHQHTAIHLPCAAPGRLIIVGLRPIPANGCIHMTDLAEQPAVQRPFQITDRWPVTVRVHDGRLNTAKPNRLPDGFSIIKCQRHRLLDHQMLARPGCHFREPRMSSAWRANTDQINLRHLPKHIVHACECRNAASRLKRFELDWVRIA
ncbi:hypothetical protein D3C81_918840 [compost metagenome]